MFCLLCLVVSASEIQSVERFVSEITYLESNATLNPTHSITHTRPVAKGGPRGAVPPAKPECPPRSSKKILHHRYCKKVNFRANVLNFACVSQQLQ